MSYFYSAVILEIIPNVNSYFSELQQINFRSYFGPFSKFRLCRPSGNKVEFDSMLQSTLSPNWTRFVGKLGWRCQKRVIFFSKNVARIV